MSVLELLVLSLLLFLFFTATLFSLGRLVAQAILSTLPARFLLLVAPGISLFAYAFLTLLVSPLPFAIGRAILLVVVSLSIAIWIRCGHWRELVQPELRFVLSYLYLTLLLTLLVSAFPHGRLDDISAEQTMGITSLPIDNLIPYNVSRYLLEGIHPSWYEVVPSWSFTDRGPLSGIANASVFYLLGLRDNAGWLGSSPRLYFVYQAFLTYLNLFAYFALYLLLSEFSGKRVALLGLLLLSTSYFTFINVLFSWPKFLMCYFLLGAVMLWQSGRRALASGLFFAGAQLAHDSAIFALPPLLFVLLIGRVRSAATFLAGFALLYSPWILYKSFVYSSPSRLMCMHLFCSLEADGQTFFQAAERYFATHSPSSIAAVKFGNLLFPFNPLPLFGEFIRLDFLPFLASASVKQFFQLSFALGFLAAPFFVLGLFHLRRSSPLLPFLIVSFGALPVFALLSGCPDNTLNHHWAYPAVACMAAVAAYGLARCGIIGGVVAGVNLGLNVVMGIIVFHFASRFAPFRHESSLLFLAQALVAMALATLFWRHLLHEPE